MKPHLFRDQDGNPVIEWIAKDRRFALWFGNEPGWTYVNKDGTIECGDLSTDIIKAIKEIIIHTP